MSQAHAGVSGGGFNDRSSTFDQAVALGCVEHFDPDSVLDGAAGIEEFGFHENLRTNPAGEARKLDQWGIADELQDIVIGFHDCLTFNNAPAAVLDRRRTLGLNSRRLRAHELCGRTRA